MRNNGAGDSYNLYEPSHNAVFMEPCLDCGERDEGKLGILMTAVKGMMTAQVGCLPCWWKKVGIKIEGENGRAVQHSEAEVCGNRERVSRKAGASVLPEGDAGKGIREPSGRERAQAV